MKDILVVYNSGKQTCILFTDKSLQRSDKSTQAFMNDLCLSKGTTLSGCYKASYNLLNGGYKRPICIGTDIYFPTHKPSLNHCHWINLNYIDYCTLETILNIINDQSIDPKRLKKQIYDAFRLKAIINTLK